MKASIMGSKTMYPQGYVIDMEKFRYKFKLGDIVKVPAVLVGLTHDESKPQEAEVVGFYRNFFNVKYPEGYEQSIQYKDAGLVVLLEEVMSA